MLRDVNIYIQTANDGVEGFEACLSTQFDIILMDISMPRMGGIEATQKIKDNCPLNKHTPVIALTGTLAGMVGAECVEIGMVACLSKPIGRKKLVETIVKYLEHRHRVWMSLKRPSL